MTDSRAFTKLLGVCVAFVIGITLSAPAQASFEDGAQAYLARDYVTALEEWRPIAEDGKAEAQFGIGLCYENGRGVERDLTQAAIWYRRAAEQGLDEAQFNLGNLYLNAAGVPKDPVEAARWFRRAAEQNMPHAQVNLGYSYETGSGVARDPFKAVAWYRRAAEQRFPQAQYYLGAAYERGSGIEKDLPLAAAWYQRAANQGVVLAAKRLDELKKIGIEPAIIEVSTAALSETPEPEKPAEAAPVEAAPETELEVEETNLIESEPPPEPESPVEPAQQPKVKEAAPEAALDEAPPATVPAGGKVDSLSGSYRVRLASYQRPANAEKGWRILSQKHGDLLGGFNYAVAEVDLGADKGIYHRLEVGPAGSLNEAAAICAELKARGDNCVIVRP